MQGNPRKGGRLGESGGAAAIGLLVGLLFVAGVFATVAEHSQRRLAEAPDQIEEPALESEADQLVDTILSAPGQGWYTVPCVGFLPDVARFSPEAVTRFGLAAEPCAQSARMNGLNLSFEKLRSLRSAGLAADPANSAVDYEEATAALEIGRRDFHLSADVLLYESQIVFERGYFDPHLRPLYLGHYVDPPGPRPAYPASSVEPEAAYLAALVSHFDPYVYDAAYRHADLDYQPGGDVMPDLKDPLGNDLPSLLVDDQGTPQDTDDVATLRNYNVLVVGSDVDHSAMTSESAKGAVEKWVEGGGLLIVFGSTAQQVHWLEPLFHSSIVNTAGNLQILLPDHPLLQVPNLLEPALYEDNDKGWNLGAQDRNNFDTVATRNEGTLLVSKEGKFDDGRIVLASFRPADPDGGGATGPCDPDDLQPECEGLRLLHNFLTFAFTPFTVDYGPAIPTDRPVVELTRLVAVYHPAMETHVEAVVRLTVW